LKFWGFRVAAVLLALAPFALAEGICVLAGWGQSSEFDDPFVGFHEVHPLFVPNARGDRYEIPPARLRFFHPESFSVVKPRNEFRIFVFGGSTVAGEPFSSETAFPNWLELALCAADSRYDWNVVNCGGISYASYRLVPILKECLGYEPDLIILSTGHNEFLEDRTYRDLKQMPAVVVAACRGAARLRTFTLLQAAVNRLKGHAAREESARQTILPDEVDARLDHAGGLASYHRDEAWARGIAEHFRYNLRRIVAMTRAAEVPLLLIQETSNLADCPPFKSEHTAGLSATELQHCRELVDASRSLLRIDVPEAANLLEQALELDSEHALTWFELGKCYETLREFDTARSAFLRARDLDICPLRMTTPLEEALREVATETLTPLVDAHQLLEQRTAEKILGDFWLVDHVHPSVAGHQAIAVAILKEMAREGEVEPVEESEARWQAAFQTHLASLPPIYFERGLRTLELLRGWTKGRVQNPAAIGPSSTSHK
jgi:lysophospholipase L1-like esterase